MPVDPQIEQLIREKYALAQKPEEKALVQQAAQRFGVNLNPPNWLDKISSGVSNATNYLGSGISRFGQALAQDANATSGVVKQGLSDLTDASNPLQGIKQLAGHTLLPTAESLGQGVMDEESKALQQFKDNSGPLLGANNRLEGGVRMLTGLVPGLGAQFGRSIDRARSGDPAGALSDDAQIAAQIFGPRGLQEAQESTIGKLGEGFYKEALPVDKSLSVTSQEAIKNQAMNARVQPRYGPAVIPEIDKLNSLIKEGMTNTDKAVAAYTGPDIKSIDSIAPVLQEIANYEKIGRRSQAAPLENSLAEYFEHHTGVPRDPKSYPLDSTPMGYISRAVNTDRGQTLPYWQDVKRAVGRLESSQVAQKSQSEIAEMAPGSRDVFNDLIQKGLRQSIQSHAPDVGEWNQQVSQAIHMKEGLEELAQKNPTKLRNIASYALGGATGGAMTALGAHTGNLPLEYAGGIAAGAIPVMLVRQAMKDPVVSARLGLAMRALGQSSVVPQTLGNLPKLRVLGPNSQGEPSQP